VALTAAGARLTERHRKNQLALRATFLREMLRSWPLLNPANLDGTAARWLELTMDLILRFRTRSVATAVDYYDRFRSAELGAEPVDRRVLLGLDAAPLDAIRTSLVVTGPARVKYRTSRGAPAEEAAQRALVDVSGAASRHVLGGGRDVLDAAAERDALAVGFARVTGPRPCAFCAMLAGRGPVYKSRAAATFTSGRSKRGAGHRYHDHCGCSVEPLFARDAPWPGKARDFEQLWMESTSGRSGKDARNAFRRALEEQRTDA
jgi:hypothetical protein